jgi:hypothetical protein
VLSLFNHTETQKSTANPALKILLHGQGAMMRRESGHAEDAANPQNTGTGPVTGIPQQALFGCSATADAQMSAGRKTASDESAC